MLLSVWDRVSLPLMVVLLGMANSQDSEEPCHIPAGQSILAEANKGAVRFTFSDIKNNQNSLLGLPNVKAVDHMYTVNQCRATVYLLSESIPNPNPFLSFVSVVGTTFNCMEIPQNSLNGLFGIVHKFITNPEKFDEVIPTPWKSGNNIIIKLYFYNGFPEKPQAAYRCRLEKIVEALNITVTASFSLQRVGCPTNLWGTTCSMSCSCQNGGECHTFKGRCLCQKGTSGLYCENRDGNPGITSSIVNDTSSTRNEQTTTTAARTTTTTKGTGFSRSTVMSTYYNTTYNTTSTQAPDQRNPTSTTKEATSQLTEQTTLEEQDQSTQAMRTTADSKSSSGGATSTTKEMMTYTVTQPSTSYKMSSTANISSSYSVVVDETVANEELSSTRQSTSPRFDTSNTSGQQRTIQTSTVTTTTLALLCLMFLCLPFVRIVAFLF